MIPYLIDDSQWLYRLTQELDQYMFQLEDNFFSPEKDLLTITGLEFCGCPECYMREQLAFMIPRIIDAYVEGTIRIF